MQKKNLLILFLTIALIFTISGCKKDEVDKVEDPTPPPVEDPVEEVKEDEQEVIISDYQKLVEEERSVEELNEYISENLPKLGQLGGNTMIDGLEKRMEEELEDLRLKLEDLDTDMELVNIIGSDGYLKEDKFDQIKNEDLKEEVIKANTNNYRILSREGNLDIGIDYRKLMDFKDKLSPEWQEYLEIKAKNIENPPYADGSLAISFDELADRILEIENYLNRYINGPRQNELLEDYEMHLTNYYKGLPNTPIAEYDTKQIFENVYKSYQKTGANEGYVTSSMIQEYQIAIRDNKMLIDETIMNLADQYIAESVRVLREFK